MSPSARRRSLDVLRAVAVLLVMARHASRHVPEAVPSPLAEVLRGLQWGGWIGVDLFFVLSGFLIAGLLLDEHARRGTIDVPRFLARRAFKIYPAFFAMIGVSVVMGATWFGPAIPLVDRDGPPVRQLWPELVFMQSYFPGVWIHTWSLAVEEHFYILLPVVLWCVFRWSAPGGRGAGHEVGASPGLPRALALAGVLAVGAPLLWRSEGVVRWPVDASPSQFGLYRHLLPSHLRMDALAMGVALACVWRAARGRVLWVARRLGYLIAPAAACAIVVVVSRPLSDSFLLTWGLSIIALGFASLLMVTISADELGWWRRVGSVGREGGPGFAARVLCSVVKGMAWLGRYSYSIYLWHLPVRAWSVISARRLGVPDDGLAMYLVKVAAVSVGAVVVGVFAARVVEVPVLMLRDRLVPSRARALRPAC